MSDMKRCPLAALIFVATAIASSAAGAESERVLAEWKFNRQTQWNGWSPGGQIRNASFTDDAVIFDAHGSDPIIVGPQFDLPEATNQQWVIIDVDCPEKGQGEFFYTNKSEGQYGGFEPKWRSTLTAGPGTGPCIVWPFWSSLGKIIRLRFDPPAGQGIKLRAIRVVETAGEAPAPAWTFGERAASWRPMYAARMNRTSAGLQVTAGRPQAVIITPVAAFDAARCSLLHLDAKCSGETDITLCWASAEDQGLFGQPVYLGDGSCTDARDLRRFPEWKGTITHLAIAFGTRGDEVLTLKSLSITDNDPGRPFLRVRYFDFDRGVVRPDQDADVRLILEHAGGPAFPAGKVEVICKDESAVCTTSSLDLPAIAPGGRAELRAPLKTRKLGAPIISFKLPNGQTFTKALLVEMPVSNPDLLARPDGYDVPRPRPLKTDYQIGVYYFPGWSADQMDRWQRQADFPERDSLLGWYDEGSPIVADWHIKWAVENGISFFIYDWYWRDGNEQLGAGLNDGFLQARYNEMMKFALMWANHPPFNKHTTEQLLTVTDYWTDRYFRRPNYLTVDGKPYVSFFSPGHLIADMGGEDNVRKAFDAMRERVRRAGLPGIHFAACTGPNRSHLDSLKRAGFDSFTAYNYVRIDTELDQTPYKHYMLAHEEIWKNLSAAGVLPYTPLLTVNWDARPWHGPRTTQNFSRGSHHFAEGVKRLKAHLDATGEKMAILEAWNEWGEGSYLEPNVEFGFADLEFIRAAFGSRTSLWSDNVCPYDVGLHNKYDLRRRVNTVGKNPGVREGLQIVCRGNLLTVLPGAYVRDGREQKTEGGEVTVAAAEMVEVKDLPIKLTGDAVNLWRGGNRLIISPKDRRNLLPDSYVPGSLVIGDPGRPDVQFETPRDYTLDTTWGAFALPPASRLKAGDAVLVNYRMSLRRVDSLVLDDQGKPRLIPGTPSADCPELPSVPADVFHLANIYRPYNAGEVETAHVYPIGQAQELQPVATSEALQPVLAKMRAGEPVTIVCWGDSVTAGGESSTPATSYVGLLESMLKRRFPEASIKVINAGIGGSSTPGRFPNYRKEVLDFKPDVVTLEFVNDMGIPTDQMQQRYTQILQQTREAGAVLVLITPHFVRPDWMHQTTPRVTADPRPNVAFLRKFAADNQVPLADAARRWEELDPLGLPYEILLRNGINHPDDRGHRFFAEELIRLFK